MDKAGFWNDRKRKGKSQLNTPDLIKDVQRNSNTAKKYEVSTETISADDLQAGVKYPQK
jgi:hypothetical protein